MHSRSILSFTLPLLLAACNSQVGSDYAGEPLVTVHGTIVNELHASPTSPIDAVLVWNNGSDSSSDVESFPAKATVAGSFPAAFTISVYAPPPAASLNDLGSLGLDDTRVGIATVEAAEGVASAGEGSALGVDEGHVLVYVESAMTPNGLWARFFGQTLAPGFHIMDVLPAAPTEQQAAFDACNAAATTETEHRACVGHQSKIRIRGSAAGVSTNLTIRMAATEELSYPDWH